MSVPIVVRGGILATNGSALPLDAFDRVRTSAPTLILSNLNARLSNRFVMDQSAPAAGISITDNLTGLTAGTLTLTAERTAADKRAVRQSYQYTPYAPGLSKSMMFTAILAPTTPVSGPAPVVTAPGVAYNRVGLFDGTNGLFWQYDWHQTIPAAAQISVNIMHQGVIIQSQTMDLFNTNTLQALTIKNDAGSGTTTAAVNFSYEQVLYIDQEYLGAGSVRFGVFVQDQLIIAHIFTNVNKLIGPYTPSPSAPVRYEATFRGSDSGVGAGSSGTVTLLEGCSAVIMEGNDYVSTSIPMAYNTQLFTGAPAAERVILAIRGTNTGAYGDGCKGGLQLESIGCVATTADTIVLRLYKVYTRAGTPYGVVSLSGAGGTTTYTNPQPGGPAGSCLVEIAENGASLDKMSLGGTGAMLCWVGSASSVSRSLASEVNFNFGLSIDGVASQLVLTAQNISGGTYSAMFTVSWREET
jgi:hypothetical protein